MKGISLAIETVVILIIAIVILGILTYFLIGQSLPGLDKIKMQQDAAALCASYVQIDTDCSGTSTEINKFSDKTAFAKLCKDLGHASCSGILNEACLKQCCSTLCPKSPLN